MLKNSNLLPCPFCGSPANPIVEHSFHPQRLADGTIYESRFVECSRNLTGCMGQGALSNSESAAISAWNTRAETPEARALKEAKAAIRMAEENFEFLNWKPYKEQMHDALARIEAIEKGGA